MLRSLTFGLGLVLWSYAAWGVVTGIVAFTASNETWRETTAANNLFAIATGLPVATCLALVLVQGEPRFGERLCGDSFRQTMGAICVAIGVSVVSLALEFVFPIIDSGFMCPLGICDETIQIHEWLRLPISILWLLFGCVFVAGQLMTRLGPLRSWLIATVITAAVIFPDTILSPHTVGFTTELAAVIGVYIWKPMIVSPLAFGLTIWIARPLIQMIGI